MKKLLSVLLVLALFCGIGAVGASAAYIDEDGNTAGGGFSHLIFWQDWSPTAQWVLKWLAFGWLWMPVWNALFSGWIGSF